MYLAAIFLGANKQVSVFVPQTSTDRHSVIRSGGGHIVNYKTNHV